MGFWVPAINWTSPRVQHKAILCYLKWIARIHKKFFSKLQTFTWMKTQRNWKAISNKKLLLQTFQLNCVVRKFKILWIRTYKMCCRKHIKIVFVCFLVKVLYYHKATVMKFPLTLYLHLYSVQFPRSTFMPSSELKNGKKPQVWSPLQAVIMSIHQHDIIYRIHSGDRFAIKSFKAN